MNRIPASSVWKHACFLCLLCLHSFGLQSVAAEERMLHAFQTTQLTDTYFSEGANAGDLNGDGHPDAVYGPHAYLGPDFKESLVIYKAVPQPRKAYADHFFCWVHDFNADGWQDVFVVGFPGTPAYVYENPGKEGHGTFWKKHAVFDSVGNESPHFTQLVGDDRPELICTRHGVFGYATVDWDHPFDDWEFHPVSGRITAVRFGHGLGVGDINGDQLLDILHPGGWFQQPQSRPDQETWIHHKAVLSNSYGGAEMYAYDVDGDGDQDVVTSLAAHDFGLAWYEQQAGENGQAEFKEHLIMGYRRDQNRYGIVFSEPHSVQLVDMDGDGLKDIVTGKTYYSHHEKSPLWDAGAVVYWFRLNRTASGVDWVPYMAAEDIGIGRQVSVADLNQDGLPDLVLGGMKGGHVVLQQKLQVSQAVWESVQPKPYEGSDSVQVRSKAVKLDPETGKAAHAIEGEAMQVLRHSKGQVSNQDMTGFQGAQWSGGKQLFWSGAEPRARLELEFQVADSGAYQVGACFTTAKDYAIINVLLDNKALTSPIDLFGYPQVGTTGLLDFGEHTLSAGKHRLTLETLGANPAATKSYMVGLDFLQLQPRDEK